MVVTSLTRNQVVRKGTWVRIPLGEKINIGVNPRGLAPFLLSRWSLGWLRCLKKQECAEENPKEKNMVLYVQLRPIRSKKSKSLGHFFGTSGHLRGHFWQKIM